MSGFANAQTKSQYRTLPGPAQDKVAQWMLVVMALVSLVGVLALIGYLVSRQGNGPIGSQNTK